MKRVIGLELVGLKKLDCDLYDEHGKIVYVKGTEFTPEMYMMLSHSQVYRLDNAKLCEETPKPIKNDKPAAEARKPDEKPPLNFAAAKEAYEKEIAALNRKFFNELNGKKLSEQELQHYNNLYKESIVVLKRKYFNELYEEEPQKRYPGNIEPGAGSNKSTTANKEGKSATDRTPDIEQAFEQVTKSEPYNNPDSAEYQSVIELEKQDALIKEVKQVLYSAINSEPVDIKSCVRATETILNEVYNKIRKVQNFNQLRVYNYYTFSHDLNVALISALIGREIGYSEAKVKDLTFSAFLHDVGKMKIPKEILYKTDSLTKEERELVKKHTILGYDFLVNVLKLPVELARPALEHHERWEGQGYPKGLVGSQISEFSQIVAIADVYDALISHKVYKSSTETTIALNIMLNEEAGSFNPKILDKFIYMGMRG
jgi:HD-GYP domain-containing protein (c-di-GMP phosphodiesterase class II)